MAESAPATQEQYPVRTAIRTGFQLVIGLAASMPILISTSGAGQLWGVPVALAVSATITRIMAMPAVNLALKIYAPWLAAEPAKD